MHSGSQLLESVLHVPPTDEGQNRRAGMRQRGRQDTGHSVLELGTDKRLADDTSGPGE
jgi:hypothetical protein